MTLPVDGDPAEVQEAGLNDADDNGRLKVEVQKTGILGEVKRQEHMHGDPESLDPGDNEHAEPKAGRYYVSSPNMAIKASTIPMATNNPPTNSKVKNLWSCFRCM